MQQNNHFRLLYSTGDGYNKEKPSSPDKFQHSTIYVDGCQDKNLYCLEDART